MENAQEHNQKLLQKLEKQVEKWELAMENSDSKQLRRQKKRIEKTVSELDRSILPSQIHDILGR